MKRLGPFLIELRLAMNTDSGRRTIGNDPRHGHFVARTYALWTSRHSTGSVDLWTLRHVPSPRWRKQLLLTIARRLSESEYRKRMGFTA